MKVVVVGGNHEADFIIKMLKENKKNQIVVINEDSVIANYLSEENNIPVFIGDPTKAYTFEELEIADFDILIALSSVDSDNYVICQIAKNIFNIKKCICTVKNPKNVDVFKKLGIDSAISSTYLLSQTVKNETTLDDIFKTLSLEDEKITITEIKIKAEFSIIGKTLKELELPKNTTISCVYRNPHVIIPNGQTMILENDKLLIISDPQTQKAVLKYVQRTTVQNEE